MTAFCTLKIVMGSIQRWPKIDIIVKFSKKNAILGKFASMYCSFLGLKWSVLEVQKRVVPLW